MVEYEFTRLGFIRDMIEPLSDNEKFRVITPGGTFEMTKAQFYDVFSNVTKTMSYVDRGLYHYPTTPGKALQFKF
ncbi:MAG TPA: hypothetical protein VGL56_18350 [Fimbriimonadaceae bacterium]|jgi:hypothetical protein